MKFHMGSRDEEGRGWGSFHSRRICCGLCCLWTHLAVKMFEPWNSPNMLRPRKRLFFISTPFLTSSVALDECVGLMGCNCSAEWPFPVLHPLKCKQLPRCSPPPAILLRDLMYLTFLWKKKKQWLKAFRFSGLLSAYKKDLFSLFFLCFFFTAACQNFASRKTNLPMLAMCLWQFGVETATWQTAKDNDAPCHIPWKTTHQ